MQNRPARQPAQADKAPPARDQIFTAELEEATRRVLQHREGQGDPAAPRPRPEAPQTVPLRPAESGSGRRSKAVLPGLRNRPEGTPLRFGLDMRPAHPADLDLSEDSAPWRAPSAPLPAPSFRETTQTPESSRETAQPSAAASPPDSVSEHAERLLDDPVLETPQDSNAASRTDQPRAFSPSAPAEPESQTASPGTGVSPMDPKELGLREDFYQEILSETDLAEAVLDSPPVNDPDPDVQSEFAGAASFASEDAPLPVLDDDLELDEPLLETHSTVAPRPMAGSSGAEEEFLAELLTPDTDAEELLFESEAPAPPAPDPAPAEDASRPAFRVVSAQERELILPETVARPLPEEDGFDAAPAEAPVETSIPEPDYILRSLHSLYRKPEIYADSEDLDVVLGYLLEVSRANSLAFLQFDRGLRAYRCTLHRGLDAWTARNWLAGMDDRYINAAAPFQSIAFDESLAPEYHFKKRFSSEFFRRHAGAFIVNLRTAGLSGFLTLFYDTWSHLAEQVLRESLPPLLRHLAPLLHRLQEQQEGRQDDSSQNTSLTDEIYEELARLSSGPGGDLQVVHLLFPELPEREDWRSGLETIAEQLRDELAPEERIFLTGPGRMLAALRTSPAGEFVAAARRAADRLELRTEAQTLRHPDDGRNLLNYVSPPGRAAPSAG